MRSAAAVLLGTLLVGIAGPRVGAAQEPDTLAPPPEAQLPSSVWDRISVAVTAGALSVSDLHIQTVVVERRGEEDAFTEAGALRRTLAADGRFHVQGSLALRFAPAWEVRLGAGLGRAGVEAGYGGDDALASEARDLAGGQRATATLVNLEAALRFSLATSRRLTPHAELGIARERWSLAARDADALPAGLEPLRDAATRWGAHVAVGATVPFTGSLHGLLQLTSTYHRTLIDPSAAGSVVAEGEDARVRFAAPGAWPFADDAVERVRVTRLEAGLSYRPGSPAAWRVAPAEPAAAPSGYRR